MFQRLLLLTGRCMTQKSINPLDDIFQDELLSVLAQNRSLSGQFVCNRY